MHRDRYTSRRFGPLRWAAALSFLCVATGACNVVADAATTAPPDTVANDATVAPKPGASPASTTAPNPVKLQEVIVVFKTHFDIGYTDLARNVVTRYRTEMIDRALTVCDASSALPPEQRFVWTLSGWPMTQILWPGQTDDRRRRIEAAVREGRLVWHALPVTMETESYDPETVVRGLGFSSRLSRRFGQVLPRDAKMTDVPSHTWLLPTVLAGAGVEFLHIGANAACPPPDVPTLFWWEGPDGSRVLTMQAGDYGSSLAPPKGWPHATWLALIHTGDNHGPPTAQEVAALLERARRDLPGVTIRLGRLSDFADAIKKEKPDLPVVRADMGDTWIHGIMSMPIETKIFRNAQPLIAATESLHTLLRVWGAEGPSVKDAVAAAYEQALLYGEHTWGYDAKRFGPRVYGDAWKAAWKAGKYKLLEESWQEHGAYARQAEGLVAPLLAANMEALARNVKADGLRVVVFDPVAARHTTDYVRGQIVTVTLPVDAPPAWKDAGTGKSVPAETDGKTLRLLVRDIPSMGYTTYVPDTGGKTAATAPVPKVHTVANDATVAPATTAPAAAGSDLAADQAAATIENACLRLKLDPTRGVIASAIDKKTGRELVDAASPHGLGQYLYERFDANDRDRYLDAYLKIKVGWAIDDVGKPGLPPASQVPHVSASPRDFTLTVRRGPLSVTAVMESAASKDVPHATRLAVTLASGLPWADLEWTILDKQPDPWPEAGWLCFAVKADKPRFRLGRPGSIIDPATDIRRKANHDVIAIDSGVAVIGSEGGLGLCPIDSPLVSLERPGVWRYESDFVPQKPLVYVNLFNNVWSTNYQQWIGGTWSSRVRVWAEEPPDEWNSITACDWDLIVYSWQARVPYVAAAFSGPAGALPVSQEGIRLCTPGTVVTAFGDNPDGPGILLRLWELAGMEWQCFVELPEGLKIKTAQPCDLRGRAVGKPLVGPNHKPASDFLVDLNRFAPASILLEPADKEVGH